jgi:hypothetical protein
LAVHLADMLFDDSRQLRRAPREADRRVKNLIREVRPARVALRPEEPGIGRLNR